MNVQRCAPRVLSEVRLNSSNRNSFVYLYVLKYTENMLESAENELWFCEEDIDHLRGTITHAMELELELITPKISTEIEEVFEKKDTRTWREKRVDRIPKTTISSEPISYSKWKTVHQGGIKTLDEFRRTFSFTQ